MTQAIQTKIPFTAAVFAQKHAEFTRFTEERKQVLERLKIAREMGDLSENGAYHAAKFELGNVSRRLLDLHFILENGYVPNVSSNTEYADFGHTLTLKNATQELTFLLVSHIEANPAENKLSVDSPIGQAVKGKKAGDLIEVITPKGKTQFTLLKIAQLAMQ